jgi:putative phosphoribosyl transferase
MFRDRKEAGQLLAGKLSNRGYLQPVVLALPRGGVPVGYQIARALDAPLDLLLVRKIGSPSHPEFAVGALVDGETPEAVLDHEEIQRLGIDERDLARVLRKEQLEIARREQLYRSGRTPIEVAGRTAIVVDDGVATGRSVVAALRSARRRRPKRVVLAVPVASPQAIEELAREVDEVVCLLRPSRLRAVGEYYEDFGEVSDEEVIGLLDQAAAFQRSRS